MASYTFKWDHPAEEVFVTGTFDNWSKSVQLERKGESFSKNVELPTTSGNILFKFVVDGHWTTDAGLPCENDAAGNVNNVLKPEELGGRSGASEQMFSINPIPATFGTGNPINLAPGQPVPHPSTYATLADDTTLDKESYERSDRYPGSEQTFGINPIPATAGLGNPINLAPGEPLPHPSTYASQEDNVTLDKASYERSDRYPGTGGGNAFDTAGGAFGIPPVSGNMIPESSLPMGNDATFEQFTSPQIRSGGGATSTAELAGQVPKEPRGVPSVVADSLHAAHASPEAAANPEAVEEKKQVEQELLWNVSGGSSTAALAGQVAKEPRGVPSVVADSLHTAHASPEAAANPEAVEEKKEVEQELLQKVSGEEGSAGQSGYISSGIETASGVPQVVADSQYDANEPSEALANETAVENKYEMEDELTSTVSQTQAAAEGGGNTIERIAADARAAVVNTASGVVHSASSAVVNTASSASSAVVNTASGVVHSAQSAVVNTASGVVQTASSWLPSSIQHAIQDMNAGKSPLAALTHSSPTTAEADRSITDFPSSTGSGQVADGVPSTVGHSIEEAREAPEAAANPEAVAEKADVERELLSQIQASQGTGESAPLFGSSPRGASRGKSFTTDDDDYETSTSQGLPAPVTESIQAARASPEAAANPEAVAEKADVERELLSQISATQEAGEPAPLAPTTPATAMSTTGSSTQGLPAAVTESIQQSHSAPEAAANPEAVREKAAVERELLSEIPKTQESGEPAPSDTAALSATAPSSAGTAPIGTAISTDYSTTAATGNTSTVGSLPLGGNAASIVDRVFAAPVDSTVGAATTTATTSKSASATTTTPSKPSGAAGTKTSTIATSSSSPQPRPQPEKKPSVGRRISLALRGGPSPSLQTRSVSGTGSSIPTTKTTTPALSTPQKPRAVSAAVGTSGTSSSSTPATAAAVSAAATAATASSSSPARPSPVSQKSTGATSEDKRRKRQSIFGKLKDKLKDI